MNPILKAIDANLHVLELQAENERLRAALEKIKQQIPTCQKWQDFEEEWREVQRLVEVALRPAEAGEVDE